MSKEWILNSALNRWGLNKKNSVGPVSAWIREANPKSVDEWREFYFRKLQSFIRTKGYEMSSEEYIEELGKKLFVKISEVIQSEISSIQEEECIAYIYSLLINRTYDGYKNEIATVYGQISKNIEYTIKAAPDKWDRKYNVDFYIEVGQKYIGIQIKPITFYNSSEAHKWRKIMRESHENFERKYGGKVFIVFSRKENGKKVIANPEVIEEIRREIERINN